MTVLSRLAQEHIPESTVAPFAQSLTHRSPLRSVRFLNPLEEGWYVLKREVQCIAALDAPIAVYFPPGVEEVPPALRLLVEPVVKVSPVCEEARYASSFQDSAHDAGPGLEGAHGLSLPRRHTLRHPVLSYYQK